MSNTLLVVNERYGPVVQGEGPTTGKPCMFLRLGGCNLQCSWCDSAYTWAWDRYDSTQELHPTEVAELVRWMQQASSTRLVITGGEPLLQGKNLQGFLEQLHTLGTTVEIETNGTLVPPFSAELVGQFNVSPKLRSSGNRRRCIYPEALAWFRYSNRAIFKFVVGALEDVDEVTELMQTHSLPKEKVWLMAEGATQQRQIENLQWLMPLATRLGYNVTPRVHILVWGAKRAV